MITVAIHQPEYFSVPSYVDKILRADVLILLDCVQFNREALQHRMKIRSTQHSGTHWLTIPIHHKFPQTIEETRISDRAWATTHRSALRAHYKHAAFFKPIWDALFLDDFFEDQRARDYVYVNTVASCSVFALEAALRARVAITARVKNVETAIRRDPATLREDKTGRIIDLVKAVGGDTYLSGYSGYDYLDLAQCMREGVHVQRQHVEIAPYPQQGAGFISGLSILDMLFNCGIDETVRRIVAGRRA